MSCWQCGTIISTSGGRCPACGAEQPTSPDDERREAQVRLSGRSSARIETERPRSSNAVLWVAAAVVLVGAAAAFAMLRGRETAAPEAAPLPSRPVATASSTAAASPDDLGPHDPRAVDPAEIFGKAKTRALAWSKDAVLISIRARPVVSGRVDIASGGSIEYFFGRPSGDGIGTGAKVAAKRLHITLVSGGTKIEEASGGSGRAALEPNCPLDAAAHAARAADGIATTEPVTALYEMSDRLEKPVWQISTGGKGGAQRLVDGMSCAVLVH